MQNNCLKLEERRRDDGTRMQSSCIELKKERRGLIKKDAEQLLMSKTREKKS